MSAKTAGSANARKAKTFIVAGMEEKYLYEK
jgi:hypothetical protein